MTATPHSPFIRTVLGDIPPDRLGFCDAHEHVLIGPSFATHSHPDFLREATDPAVAELREFASAGGQSMVDAMPCSAGREILKLADISRRSGVHIIASTGLHLGKYYEPGHWSERYSAGSLADLFDDDITIGIDRHDYRGPLIERTPHRAGVIKIATDNDRPGERDRRLLAAAAQAHVRTGCPILTHTEAGIGAETQIDILLSAGVAPAALTISHLDRHPDTAWIRSLLDRGVNLEFDSAFRWPPDQTNRTLDLVLELSGPYPGQLLLGLDAARNRYWTSLGGAPGLAFLPGGFRRQLRNAGLTEADCRRMFYENPARAFSFTTPHLQPSPL